MSWDGTFTPRGNESFLSKGVEGKVEGEKGVRIQKIKVEFVKPTGEGEKFFRIYILPILQKWAEKRVEVEVEIGNGKKKVGILKRVDKEKILLESVGEIRVEEIRIISRWETIELIPISVY